MPRPSATFGEPIRTIFLPRSESAPTEEALSVCFNVAKEHPGFDVELLWALPGCSNTLKLMALWLKGSPCPSWRLTEIDGGEKTVIWNADTAEVAMVGEIVNKYSAALFRVGESPPMEAVAVEIEGEEADDWVVDSEEEEIQDVKKNELEFLGEASTSVQVLADQLVNLATGFHSFSALLKFLELEFYRFDACGVPVSLVVFEIAHPTIKPIPLQAVSTAALRIEMIKRPSDIAGHFETHDYALVLPNTQRPTASLIANKVLQVLTAGPLAPGLDKSTIKLSFGIATLPDDGDDLESLIMSAKTAKNLAKERALSY